MNVGILQDEKEQIQTRMSGIILKTYPRPLFARPVVVVLADFRYATTEENDKHV